MLKRIKFLTILLALLCTLGINAQVTTSSMTGEINDEANEPLIGATVQATHKPSGTRYNAVTNLDGRFTIQGMRTGGPYEVKITYVGYQDEVLTDIYLQLGNPYTLDVNMSTDAQTLGEIVVTGQGKRQQAGAGANFSTNNINNTATIDRNIYDVVKSMPMVNKSKLGGISFTGTNVRYNSFQIDGTVSNDVYGLSSDGTNGSQSGANPISMDAIQEIQVVIAPFDVRQGGFTGGGINAITKQGSNDFHATLYSYYNNQDFYGRYNASRDYVKDKLTKEHQLTLGGNISGPIVRDKLFFFANVEHRSESYPSSYYPGISSDYLSASDAQRAIDKYYQLTGIQESFGKRDVKQRSFDILARLDWNINENNKFAFRYQHMDAYDDKYSAGKNTYYFNGSGFRMNNVTNSFVAELNTNFGSKAYNELRASYNRVRDHRDVDYQGPLFWIKNCSSEDGSRSNITVNLGTDYSSGANKLDQDIYTFEDNLSFYLGRHTFTVGTHNEIFRIKNLFIQAACGEWVYTGGLESFFNDSPDQFVFKCSDPTITEGDLRWSPVVKAGQFGLYAQDKFDVNRNLQFTYGLRIDVPVMFSNPSTNVEFNQWAYNVTNDATDSRSIKSRVGVLPKTKVMFSPRFGFRWYTDDSHNTLFRGGLGLFTGRVPFVWLSNAFGNTGVEMTGTTINDASKIPAITNNPNDLIEALQSGTAPTPDIVTIDKKFRYPQVFRVNLAWEQILPADVKFTLEGIYSKTFNQIYYDNLALTQTGSVYGISGVEASAAPFYSVDSKYYSVINTSNTDKGYSFSISAKVEKSFDFGLNLMASYTYGQSKSVNDGTNSVAYSGWKYNYDVDPNHPHLAYSIYDQPHRILATASYTTPKYANGWLQTTVSLTYNGTSGQRYALTMNETSDYNGDGYRGNSLLYIPTSDELSKMIFTDITAKDSEGKTYVKQSADEQRALFEDFITSNSYTKNHRGQYAERNCCVAPFEHQFDLHIGQSIFALRERGSKILLTFDMLNIGNLFNKKWGTHWASAYNVQPLKCVGLQKEANGVYVGKYQWYDYTDPNKSDISSRWHAQIGVKLIF